MRMSPYLCLIVSVLSGMVLPVAEGNCYIKSTGSCVPSTTAPCYDWLNVTEHFNDCVKACNTLFLIPGMYFLNRTLSASDHSSVSIIGASSYATKIICNLDSHSLFIAANIHRFKMMNITLINCGGTLEYANVSGSDMAVVLMYDVVSAEISNVNFRKTQGYAVFGVNIYNNFSILNVSIIGQTSLNYSKGVMLLNSPTIATSIANPNRLWYLFVSINNCRFYNMHSNSNTTKRYNKDFISLHHDVTAIGLIIYQQATINISNTRFEKIVSNNIPLVLISYSIDKPTFAVVINSIFTNIHCTASSVVNVKFLVQPVQNSSCLHKFSVQNCVFSHNNATQLIHMISPNAAENCGVPLIKVKIKFLRVLFISNTAVSTLWKINMNRIISNTSVLIADCSFSSNDASDLSFEDIYLLAMKGINVFKTNYAEVLIYISHSASFSIEGNANFYNNRVNTLFYLSKHLLLDANTLLNITNNQIKGRNDILQHQNFYLMYILPDELSLDICPFQISTCTNNVTSSIIILNTTGYHALIYGYSLDNCKWNNYCNQSHNNLIPDIIIQDDQSNNEPISGGESAICLCDIDLLDCSNPSETRINNPIYPGQSISVPLASKAFNLPVAVASYTKEGVSVCENVNSKTCLLSPQEQIIYPTCTNITYTIQSNSTDWCMLCFKTVTQLQNNSLYSFNITLKDCPLGMIVYNGLCICDPELQMAVKGLVCNSDGTIVRPPYTWISAIHLTHNVTDVVYSTECYMDYCSKSVTLNLNLYDPDAQCLGNRGGKMCGKCPKGLSVVFGTNHCKKCTNIWLLLIPVFALAGILLVWLLFTLNLTVKDGHIYGYILYVNSLSLYGSRIFPSNYLIYFPILMSDLDLGIEVCFYNGMTKYATIWLQFIFPVYLILLVVGLSFASKYSRVFERLTRKRVIPVLATLYLLVYNKMMFITARGLVVYRTLHYLKSHKTETYWSLHTEIPLFGLEFSLLFAFCILILLLVLLPTTILLLFSKPLLKYRMVVKYFKPFLDAYQAPFKDHCYYFLGLELILRVILYGSESLRADYTALIYAITALCYLAYLSFQQPFKNSLNSIIYTAYLCILGCIAILIIYHPISKPLVYTIMFNSLVGIGFTMFLMIILLHIFKYHKNVLIMCSKRFWKCMIVFFHAQDAGQEIEMEEAYHTQYRENLLALDTNT